MKVYYITFKGKWIGGDAIVVADGKTKALRMVYRRYVKSVCAVESFKEFREGADIEELDITSKGIKTFQDGDY